MSRCRSCDTPLVGAVRYKDNEELVGLYIEEDMCNKCIRDTEILEYIDVKTYQFEDITENLLSIVAHNYT